MIALLSGNLAAKSPDFIVLDVNGVGYRVQIPFSTYYELPEEGAPVVLHIHTHVKEDAIHLYGFRTPREKELFQLLISVSGIGPRMANAVLSNVQPQELCDAIGRGDVGRLSMVPGVGKKTAERLVLELRDKLRKLSPVPAQAERGEVKQGVREDVVSALVNLGYKEALVRKALDSLDPDSSEGVEEVLRRALKVLMK